MFVNEYIDRVDYINVENTLLSWFYARLLMQPFVVNRNITVINNKYV